ncbi:MAG: ATP-binding protein [Bryobacteraceae bacterium]
MSLKSQLRISIVTLVTLAVIAQSVMSLRLAAEDKFKVALERAGAIAEQVGQLVLQRLNEQMRAARPTPGADLKELVQRLTREDETLAQLLPKTAVSTEGVMEIMVCDDLGVILVSSQKDRARQTYESVPDLSEWQKRALWDRIVEVVIQNRFRDYAIVTPIGFQGVAAGKPILSIRVVVSTLLIHKTITEHVEGMAAVSLLTLGASVILAYLFSTRLLRSLDRLSQRISSIATGEFVPGTPGSGKEAKEFADMQSNLDVLSQQFRGAKEDVVQLQADIDRMIDRLEEGVIVFDPQQRVIRASRSAEHLLGLTAEQIRGKNVAELFPAGTGLGDLLAGAFAARQSASDRPVEFARAGGTPIRLLATVELLDVDAAGRASVLLTLKDAETRSQIRSQLDVSTRLTAMSRLTGGVAHEIKNPLNAMALHLEILKSKLNGEDNVQNELRVLGGEISRLDRVVKTFIEFTRPVDLRRKTLDLGEMARHVVALVGPGAHQAGIEVRLTTDSEPLQIEGDEDLMKQALLNVVNNGIESMKPGGKLDVKVGRDAEEVVVTVSDEGSGISPAVRDKIFNLYFTTKQKGTGIGLAMTFRIVQFHDGAIDFTSEPGMGTTFRMRFPVAPAVAAVPQSSRRADDGHTIGAFS